MALILGIISSSQNDIFIQIEQIKSGENKFKHIFENIEEPIIILEGQQGKYANDSFLLRFSDKLKIAKVTEVKIEEKLSTCKRLKQELVGKKSAKKERKFQSSFYEEKMFALESNEAESHSILDILRQGKVFVKDKKFVILGCQNREDGQKTFVEIKLT